MSSESIVKRILDWTAKQTDKIDENTKHPFVKAFGLGAIEGAIDAVVFMYPILFGACIYWRHRATK